MKSVWKWILGILIVLVIIAVPFILHYTLGYNLGFGFARGFEHGQGPMMNGYRGPMPHNFGGWQGGPMMGRYMFGFGFLGPFMFFGGLLKLAFFGLLLYGAYWLGKRNARISLDPAPAAQVPAVEPEAAPKRGRKVA